MIYDKNFELVFELESSQLRQFSNEEVERLMDDYYDNHYRPQDVIKKYQLKVKPNQVYKLFPPIKCNMDYFKCPYDHNKLLLKHNPKSKVKKGGRFTLLNGGCIQCGHNPFIDCDCKNCRDANKFYKKDQLNFVVNEERKAPALAIDELTATDKLYLAALLRGFLSKDQKVIYGFSLKPVQKVLLSKSNHRIIQIFEHLLYRGIITVSTTSNLDAIHLDANHKVSHYSLDKVNYDLNIKNPFKTRKELLNYLKNPPREKFLRKKKTCLKLWRMLALDECKTFLDVLISELLFDGVHLTNMTNKVINELLENLSQGQIFYLIYNAVIDGSTLDGDSNMTKKKIVNSIIGHIETEGNKAVQNNLKLPSYFWPEDIETSKINKVFFDDILQIPECGMEMVPTSNLK